MNITIVPQVMPNAMPMPTPCFSHPARKNRAAAVSPLAGIENHSGSRFVQAKNRRRI